jgi:deazaflavin-dependent oxidoreductase (nitroreductase family)
MKLLMSPAGWAMDRFMVRWFGISPLSRAFARLNGLQDKGRYLLLVVTGRKTGRKRSAALSYFEIDGRLLVVGSKGGAPTDPAWVTNLRADPNATIYIDRKPCRVTARIAAGDERANLWQKLSIDVPTYAEFQKGIAREIPLVIFERLRGD